jgi:hypothetical protein
VSSEFSPAVKTTRFSCFFDPRTISEFVPKFKFQLYSFHTHLTALNQNSVIKQLSQFTANAQILPSAASSNNPRSIALISLYLTFSIRTKERALRFELQSRYTFSFFE